MRELGSKGAPIFYETFGVGPGGRTVHAHPMFSVVVDLSPVMPGHALLVPHAHYLNMAEVIRTHGAEFIDAAVAFLEDYVGIYGVFTVIEHGTSEDEPRLGSCVEHAHWHIFPVDSPKVEQIVRNDLLAFQVTELSSIENFGRISGDHSYIFYWSKNSKVVYRDTTPPHRQYARSVVARYLGYNQPADWAWDTCPAPGALRATIETLRTQNVSYIDSINGSSNL